MTSANIGRVKAAISSDALFGKSKVYIRRALSAKKSQDLDGYQLWAALHAANHHETKLAH